MKLKFLKLKLTVNWWIKVFKAVEKMTFKFDWTKYTETYTQEVKELIEKKFLGEELEVTEFKLPETRSIEAELEKMLEGK